MSTTGDRWHCRCGRTFTAEEMAAAWRQAVASRKRGAGRQRGKWAARCNCTRPLDEAKLEKAHNN